MLRPAAFGPKPGALGLLTPAQRGLALAIMQAERCGRGGDDLAVLSGNYDHSSADSQLSRRIGLLGQSYHLPGSKPVDEERRK